jgi:hypothetical protein
MFVECKKIFLSCNLLDMNYLQIAKQRMLSRRKSTSEVEQKSSQLWIALGTNVLSSILLFLDLTSVARALRCCSRWNTPSVWTLVLRRETVGDKYLEFVTSLLSKRRHHLSINLPELAIDTVSSASSSRLCDGVRARRKLEASKNWRTRTPTAVVSRTCDKVSSRLQLDLNAEVPAVLAGEEVLCPHSLNVQSNLGLNNVDVRLCEVHSGQVVYALRSQLNDASSPLFTFPLPNRSTSTSASISSSTPFTIANTSTQLQHQRAVRLDGHSGSVRFLSTYSNFALSAASDKTVRLWDVHPDAPRQLGVFHMPAQVYRWLPDWISGRVYVELLKPPTKTENGNLARHSFLDLRTGELQTLSPTIFTDGHASCVLAIRNNWLAVHHKSSCFTEIRDLRAHSNAVVCKLPSVRTDDLAPGLLFAESNGVVLRPQTDSCDSCVLRIYDARKWSERTRLRASLNRGSESVWLEDASAPEDEFMQHSIDWTNNGHCCTHRASINNWTCDGSGLLVHASFKPVGGLKSRHRLALFQF